MDGVASIVYLIPKEEFLEREREFEEMITAILNDCLSDDYSEFEKILALYEYMTTRYTYDYDMYERNDENWMERQSPYRCLKEKQGTFSRDEFDLAAAGDQTRQYFDFHADSADYSELWDGVYPGMDRTSREVVYLDENDETRRLSYA